jgi:flagellar motor component MotA
MTTLFAMIATFLGTVLVAVPAAWVLAIKATTKAEIAKLVRETGLGNMDTVKMYGRAVKIIRRLDGLTELDGDLSADMLSPQSKRLVTEWVADYRKAVSEGKVRAASEAGK